MSSSTTIHKEEKIESLLISPEEYLRIEELVEVKLEYANGKIIPKEGSEPLPDWVVRELLKPDFDEKTLDFEFPMATKNHGRLATKISFLLMSQLLDQSFEVYTQSPSVYISLTGKYRVPDVTVAHDEERQLMQDEYLLNPIAIFEVLSPSTAPKDYSEKLHEYLSIESLQEYFLVSQDQIRVERFQRVEGERWEYEVFREEILPVSSVEVELELKEVYKDIFSN